jgi:hypothetical protein
LAATITDGNGNVHGHVQSPLPARERGRGEGLQRYFGKMVKYSSQEESPYICSRRIAFTHAGKGVRDEFYPPVGVMRTAAIGTA